MKLKKQKETAKEMSISLFPSATKQEHEDITAMLIAYSQLRNLRLSRTTDKQKEEAEEYIKLALKLKPEVFHLPQELYAQVLLGELVRRKTLPELNSYKEISKVKRLLTSYRHW